MSMSDPNEAQYLAIRDEAEAAAGPVSSLRVRARGYLDLYHQSNGVCVFALVAANGALWASWYLICAKLAAMVFACTDPTGRMSPRTRYRQFAAYVMVLKDINKLVMLETYVLVHTIQRLGVEVAIAKGIPADLAHDYAKAMTAQRPRPTILRDLYHRHFLWEQERVVSTKLEEGFAAFTWPFMSQLCQRPWVWFGYFRPGKSMNFRNFTDQAERVEKGLIAYDRAVAMGLERIARLSAARIKIYPGRAAFLKRPAHGIAEPSSIGQGR